MTDEYTSDDGPGSDLFDSYETGWWKSIASDDSAPADQPARVATAKVMLSSESIPGTAVRTMKSRVICVIRSMTNLRLNINWLSPCIHFQAVAVQSNDQMTCFIGYKRGFKAGLVHSTGSYASQPGQGDHNWDRYALKGSFPQQHQSCAPTRQFPPQPVQSNQRGSAT